MRAIDSVAITLQLRQQHFPQGVAPGNWGAIVANLRIESATAALTARRTDTLPDI
jgi:hypothetical protein